MEVSSPPFPMKKILTTIVMLLILSSISFAVIRVDISETFTETDPIWNSEKANYVTSIMFNSIGNWSADKDNYFNKTEVNSTGLINLICSNGQILQFSTATNKWQCGNDASGLTAIYSGNALAYITGSDTVNVNQTALDGLYYSVSNPAGYITGYNETDPRYSADNSSIARIGSCSEGYVVQNTTTNGVECVSVSVLANISIYSGDDYTYITGQDTVNVNASRFAQDFMYLNGTNSNASYINFWTDYSDGSAEGRLQWNTEDGTLEVGMPGGNVNLQIGQEQLYRVTNDEAFQINNGDIVYISGGSGSNILVKLANADNETKAHNVLGMATENITSGQKGYITAVGLVRDIDTSLYAPGTLLYLNNSDGEYTDAVPIAPAHTVQIGHVIRQHATEGSVLVNINIGEHLTYLDDVRIVSPTNGQALLYNASSGLWYNADIPPGGINESFANATYARIDGLNQPFTGNISAPKMTTSNNSWGMCYNGTDYILGYLEGISCV